MPDSFLEKEPDAARGLLRALRNTGVSVVYQNWKLNVLWAQNVPASWSSKSIVGRSDSDYLPVSVASRVISAKHAVLAGSPPQRLEISLPGPDGEVWFDLWVDADESQDGARGVVTTAVDITDQKRREQTLRALLREVSHRSKNLLAIIQSIATQTGRYSGTIEGFLTRFRGRIQSLSSSQDLVTSSNWRGAGLYELVYGQVARYSATPQRAIRFAGARPWLNPNAALHVGLALHELAVNSVSFGALSRPEGYVSVNADLTEAPSSDAVLTLTWTELIQSGPSPAGEAPRNKRFGSVALERVVPAALNGSATLEIASGHLEYRLTIPSGNFEYE